MKYTFVFTEDALGDLRRLENTIARRITKKLHFWTQQSNPLSFAKPIQGTGHVTYRFRVGDYRILFEVTKDGVIKILLILAIRHRREVYRV